LPVSWVPLRAFRPSLRELRRNSSTRSKCGCLFGPTNGTSGHAEPSPAQTSQSCQARLRQGTTATALKYVRTAFWPDPPVHGPNGDCSLPGSCVTSFGTSARRLWSSSGRLWGDLPGAAARISKPARIIFLMMRCDVGSLHAGDSISGFFLCSGPWAFETGTCRVACAWALPTCSCGGKAARRSGKGTFLSPGGLISQRPAEV